MHPLLQKGQNTTVKGQGYVIPQKLGYLLGINLAKSVQHQFSYFGEKTLNWVKNRFLTKLTYFDPNLKTNFNHFLHRFFLALKIFC